MIKLVSIDKIKNHPENPRKDLGDLTELADSIKQNGILQNLTIVPYEDGHCGSCKHDNPQTGWCKIDHQGGVPCTGWESKGVYTVVIGHRRLAAAKKAGLTEVPCSIADMDYKTQIGTMLAENMQRSDLTVYEQAQGFQMMMDLGETVSSISEETGFSESTVRRRMKLLELDQEKLKKTMGRGATLSDYVELEKIEDIEVRNQVLEKIGTNDFDWTLRRAINEEQRKKKLNEILLEVKKFATETKDTSRLEYETAYWGRPSEKFTIPENVDEVEYFYEIKHDYIYLYYKSPESEDLDKRKEEREKLRKEKHLKLENLTEIAYELRRGFIKNISNTKARKNMNTIIEGTLYTMAESYYSLNYEEMADIMDIDISDKENIEWKDIAGDIWKQPELYLLKSTYYILDNPSENYFNWNCEYRPNESLDYVYDFLKKLGYKMSDEEIALQNGTHEVFVDIEWPTDKKY